MSVHGLQEDVGRNRTGRISGHGLQEVTFVEHQGEQNQQNIWTWPPRSDVRRASGRTRPPEYLDMASKKTSDRTGLAEYLDMASKK